MSLINRPRIAIVGHGFQLATATAYLSEKLRYLKPIILAIEDSAASSITDLKFAFPPFGEPISPILQSHLKSSALHNIAIQTPKLAGELQFNFSPYGVASAYVTFPQAYEICRKQDNSFPSYDRFLGVKKPPSSGFIYSHQVLSPLFRCLAISNGATYIVTNGFKATVSLEKSEVLSIVTSFGQLVEADFFIDCTQHGQLMSELQRSKPIPKDVIPGWSLNKSSTPIKSSETTWKIKFERNQVDLEVAHENQNHMVSYLFNPEYNTLSASFYDRPWIGNCASIGHGFAHFPELIICNDRLLEKQLMVLSCLLGVNSNTAHSQTHFNTISIRQLNETLDSCNLLLSTLNIKDISLNERNQHRTKLFRSSANTCKENNVLVSESSWTGLLHAAGIRPEHVNAVTTASDPQRLYNLTKSLI